MALLTYSQRFSRDIVRRLKVIEAKQVLSSSMSTMMNSVIDAFKALGKGIQYVGTSLKNLPKNVATATMSVCKAIVDGAKLLGKSSDTGEGKRSLMKHVLSVVHRKMSNLFKAMGKNATGKEKGLCDIKADEYRKSKPSSLDVLKAIDKLKEEEWKAKQQEEFRAERKGEAPILTTSDKPATKKINASLAALRAKRKGVFPAGLRRGGKSSKGLGR